MFAGMARSTKIFLDLSSIVVVLNEKCAYVQLEQTGQLTCDIYKSNDKFEQIYTDR